MRIHHAAAQHFDPAAALAKRASLAAALEATDLHVSAGFGEGKEGRVKARAHARAKHRLHGMIKRAFQVAEGDVGVHRQAFDLMEHRRVRGIGRIVPVDFARDHNADRRRLLLHGARLHRRSVGAQQQAVALRF